MHFALGYELSFTSLFYIQKTFEEIRDNLKAFTAYAIICSFELITNVDNMFIDIILAIIS